MRRLLLPVAVALTAAACVEPTLTQTNDPPVVVIQRPGDGATFAEGEGIDFVGKVADDGSLEGVVTTWLDNGTTPLSIAGAPDAEGFVTFTTADLSVGTHAVSLRAVDASNLSADASVTLEITAVADEPTLSIVAPLAGAHIPTGALTLFEATVSDAKDAPGDLIVELESDLDGFLCQLDVDSVGDATCQASLTSEGAHKLTFTVTDTDAFSRDKAVVVVADPVPQDPTITAVSPTSGGRVRQSTVLQFEADVSDTQDRPTALVATLASDVDGSLCTLVIDSNGRGVCFATLSTLGNQILSYEVTDTDGNTASANLLLSVSDGTDIDDDLDGFTENQGDCDDDNRAVYPSATELPNRVDDNCDGNMDEGTVLVDDDGDGFCESTTAACTDGTAPGDCNDASARVNPDEAEECSNGVDDNCSGVENEPGASGCFTYYADTDGDGYGDANASICGCTLPASGSLRALDCNDAVPSINPTSTETPDGIDQDCDDLIDEGTNRYDNDGDGYCAAASCSVQPGGSQPGGGDCDDVDPNIAPNKAEVCGNGVDDNCNTQSDEGQDAIGCLDYFRDDDLDGYGFGAGQCLCGPSATLVRTNNLDCYDQNPDAKPGQSAWFTTSRGDGSFDYNCLSGDEQKYSAGYDCGCPASTFDASPFVEGWDNNAGCGQFGTWATGCSYITAQLDNPFYPFLGGPFITECVSDSPTGIVGRQQQCH